MQSLISQMEAKDWITLVFSLLAFLTSGAVAIITYQKAKIEFPKLQLELEKLRRETETTKQAVAAIQFPGFREFYRSDGTGAVGFDFTSGLGFIYSENAPVGAKGEGFVEFLKDDVIKLCKVNAEGRTELRLNQVMEAEYGGVRNTRIVGEVRAPQGAITLKFVLYDPDSKNYKWVTQAQERRISNPDWEKLDLFFTDSGVRRAKLRIDLQAPAKTPTFLLLRKLVVLQREPI